MEYNYNVKLELANDKKRSDFNFSSIEGEIKTAIDQYHDLTTVRHKKTLSYTITPQILEIGIKSPIQLDVPSKALAKFTRMLIELSPKLAATIANGRVFRSVQTSMPSSDMDKLSSCETLKKLVDLFCGEKSDASLALQRKIKELIFSCSPCA